MGLSPAGPDRNARCEGARTRPGPQDGMIGRPLQALDPINGAMVWRIRALADATFASGLAFRGVFPALEPRCSQANVPSRRIRSLGKD